MAKAHLTPEGWRCEKLREHLYRARWMDYQSPSIQMLTLMTVDRKPLLAELRGETTHLTPLGTAVAREIERIPTYLGAASIEILDYVIMPDHVHILLRIHDRLPKHLGQYIRWFKVQCSDAFTAMVETAREVMARGVITRGDTREANNANTNASASNACNTASNATTASTNAMARGDTREANNANTNASASNACNTASNATTASTNAMVRGDTRESNNATTTASTTTAASATTASTTATASGWVSREEASRVLAGVSASMVSPKSKNLLLFAHEYHDSLLYGRGQLARMKNYIKENPRRLALKRANRELFRIRQDYTIGRFSCTVLGNIFLAGHPQRQVLQCSRRLTPEQIEERRSECLMQAANGAVFITAAISPGEKAIARSLREHGFPLIILLEQGFPKPESSHYRYFKPQGVYFEACAAGRLLLVEPHAEALERPEVARRVIAKTGNIPHTTQRYRFVAMNVIAEEMCGDDTLA
ncbi:MAG: hypothetical protein IJC77_06250 [Bacteroidaceae bacterium]|nr:hypothetical protein [Bacteroidaceae bacterium]